MRPESHFQRLIRMGNLYGGGGGGAIQGPPGGRPQWGRLKAVQMSSTSKVQPTFGDPLTKADNRQDCTTFSLLWKLLHLHSTYLEEGRNTDVLQIVKYLHIPGWRDALSSLLVFPCDIVVLHPSPSPPSSHSTHVKFLVARQNGKQDASTNESLFSRPDRQ